jgi:hypothetical protein
LSRTISKSTSRTSSLSTLSFRPVAMPHPPADVETSAHQHECSTVCEASVPVANCHGLAALSVPLHGCAALEVWVAFLEPASDHCSLPACVAASACSVAAFRHRRDLLLQTVIHSLRESEFPFESSTGNYGKPKSIFRIFRFSHSRPMQQPEQGF